MQSVCIHRLTITEVTHSPCPWSSTSTKGMRTKGVPSHAWADANKCCGPDEVRPSKQKLMAITESRSIWSGLFLMILMICGLARNWLPWMWLNSEHLCLEVPKWGSKTITANGPGIWHRWKGSSCSTQRGDQTIARGRGKSHRRPYWKMPDSDHPFAWLMWPGFVCCDTLGRQLRRECKRGHQSRPGRL